MKKAYFFLTILLLGAILLSAYLIAFLPYMQKSRVLHTKQISSIAIDSPLSDNARTPKFVGLDNSFLDESLGKEKIDDYKTHIETLNKTQKNLNWKRKHWNLQFFSEQNLPVVVGKIENTHLFSSHYKKEGLRFLDLPIYMPDQGWRIPVELEQFKEVIKMAVEHERACCPDFEKNQYVYITVDQGRVEPKISQRRAGWHSDSYRCLDKNSSANNILVDHIYVIYDNCPTLYVEGPFSFDTIDSKNIAEVLEMFSAQAQAKEKILYPPYTLLRMDPYCIHDAGVNESDEAVNRTFVKISFSKTKYRHLGNAHNNLFIYDWPMEPRKKVPYTQEAIRLSAHREDRDLFLEIDPSDIDFEHNITHVLWASKDIKKVSKTGTVYAERAQEGEMVETKDNDSIVTISVAAEGDYKIYFSPKDVWLLSKEKFDEIYEPVTGKSNTYKIKPDIRYAVQLNQDVRMRAWWGTMSYAKAGDYLVYRKKDDIYFVPKHIFETSYTTLQEQSCY